MAATQPPSIPVRQTIKSLYQPISKLNGDQLSMLRKVKRPEFSGRISLYNQYTERVLNTALNVSHKQHEHTMETIRKEQAHIYKSLCRIKKLQRRVQRDEHEERREEIRNMFKRQRKRNLMRRVIAKFKENVIKKRAEMMVLQVAEGKEGEDRDPVLTSQGLIKFASTFRRHTQPDVGKEIEEVKAILETGSDNSTANKDIKNHPNEPLDQITTTCYSEQHNDKTEKDRTVDWSESGQKKEQNKQESSKISKMKENKLHNSIVNNNNNNNIKTTRKSKKKPGGSIGVNLHVIPEVTFTKSCEESLNLDGGEDDKESKTGESKSRGKILKSNPSSLSLPCDLSALSEDQGGDINGNNFSKQLPHRRGSSGMLHRSSPNGDHHFCNDSVIDQVARENSSQEFNLLILSSTENNNNNDNNNRDSNSDARTFIVDNALKPDNNSFVKLPPLNLCRGYNNDNDKDNDDINNIADSLDGMKEAGGFNEQTGNTTAATFLTGIKGRKNLVKVIERQRARRAKARTRILDEEPFTRYSRKPQEPIKAMCGMPKRAEFIPPSKKLRHEQEKLMRREQDKEIQSHINIERFFHEVFQTKEPVVYRQPAIEQEVAPKKPALSLAGILSQLYTSSETSDGDKNSMEQLKACQYLRMYKPLDKKDKHSDEHHETSWAVAEEKLRAGFMTISLMPK